MRLTQDQINEFTKRARTAGLSEDQIKYEIEKKFKEMSGTQTNPPIRINNPPSNETPTAPSSENYGVSPNDVSQQGVSGFVANFIKGLAQPAIEYGKFIGEAGHQTTRFVFDPVFRKAVLGQELSPEEAKKLATENPTAFYSKEEGERKLGDRGKIALTGAKAVAGMESYFIPFGKGANLATKVFLPGFATGALSEFSREDATPESVIKSGVQGSAIAGIFHGAGKFISSVFEKIGPGSADVAEKTYAQAFNVPRASAQKLGIKPLETSRKLLEYKIQGSADKILDSSETVMSELSSAVHEAVGVSDKVVGYGDDLVKIGKSIDRMGGLDSNAKKSLKDALRAIFSGKEHISPNGIRADDALDAIRELQQQGMKAHISANRTGDLATQQIADAYFGLAEDLSSNLNKTIGKEGVAKVITPELISKIKTVSPKLAEEVANAQTVSQLRSLQKPFVDASKMIAFSEDAASAGGQHLVTRGLAALGGGVAAGPVGAAVGAIFGPTAQAGMEAVRPLVMTNIATAISSLDSPLIKKIGLEVGKAISQVDIERLAAMTPSILKERGLKEDEIQKVKNIFDTATVGIEKNVGVEEQINKPTTEKINTQPSPLNPFGGLTKRQVQALALSQGASFAQMEEVGKVYDMLSSDGDVVDKDTRAIADSLRQEYFKRSQENKFIDVLNAYKKVESTSDTAAGDVSLIFAFMKILDPGSVVREGEFATAEQTAGIPQQIILQYNKALKGERLSPQQRTAYKNEAGRVFQVYQQRQAPIDAYYQGLAKKYGIDPSLLGVGLYH